MMHDQRTQAVLWTASAGFEVACLYSWASFTLTLVHERPYSLWQAAAAFGCGSLAAGWLRRSQLQGVERGLVHGFSLLALSVLALCCDAALLRSQTLQEWLTVSVTLGWIGVLWFTGARHGREDLSYARLCGRFDRAVGWLAELFVVKILLRLLPKPGLSLTDGIAGAHVAAFFLFALVALVSARSRGEARTSLIEVQSAQSEIGPLLGLGSGISLCALGLALLLLPQLRAAAQAVIALLAPLAGPLGALFKLLLSAFFAVLRFLIGPGFSAPDQDAPPDTSHLPPDEQPDTTWLETQHDSDSWLWLPVAVLSALLLCSLGWIAWRYARRRRTPAATPSLWRSWQPFGWFARDNRPEALWLYTKLEVWGRRSGVATRPHETPLEYSARLQQHLPSARAEIDVIVRALNLHLYAPASRPLLTLHVERTALRRLHSPRLWPQRFMLRVLGKPACAAKSSWVVE